MIKLLSWVGVLITLIYLGLIIWIKGNHLLEIEDLKLNEFGDFLAGAFGPVAVLWLILGFFQQGHELKNSIAAANAQGKELEAANAIQRELLEYTRRSFVSETKRLEHERIARSEGLEPDLSVTLRVRLDDAEKYSYVYRIENQGTSIYKVLISVSSMGEIFCSNEIGDLFRHHVEEKNDIKSKDCRYISDRVDVEIKYTRADGVDAVQIFEFDPVPQNTSTRLIGRRKT